MVAEQRLRDEIEKQLPTNTCFVHDLRIFDNPSNFPQLKGSLSLAIRAEPSFDHPKIFAIAVTATAVQGIYVEQQFLMFTFPVLIETEADYAIGAKGVAMMLSSSSDAVTKGRHGRK